MQLVQLKFYQVHHNKRDKDKEGQSESFCARGREMRERSNQPTSERKQQERENSRENKNKKNQKQFKERKVLIKTQKTKIHRKMKRKTNQPTNGTQRTKIYIAFTSITKKKPELKLAS